ncbi:prepilin-type N-terminal cleavage/methylation domain-containing protein [candidate division CSSED10-310 bacterium]|uniref:Prepilin-type N-terminal cleavage/methylation domain-containing protein n=1 Tax=candidate division CSSED10-310 bacterium TaxID=2855610 RepID=A0ABV6Z5Y8_UNCC1
MNLNRKINHEAGFTLIEMLVVLAITSVIFAAIFWSLTFQQMSAQRQTSLADIYDNQRFGMDIIQRYIRIAGLNMNAQKFSSAILGLMNFQPLSHEDAWSQGTDRLTVSYIYDNDDCGPVDLSATMPRTSAELKCETLNQCWIDKKGPPMIEFQALIIDPTESYATLFVITMIQTSDHIQHNTGTTSIGIQNATNDLGYHYPKGSTILMIERAEQQRFFIDFVTDPGHPRLAMENLNTNVVVHLATDVEDLQFAFATDSNDDNLIDDVNGNGTIDGGDYQTTVVDDDYIKAVRTSMCFRSRDWTTKVAQNVRPSIENHAGSSTPDGFSRKTISSRVSVRNLSPAYMGGF